MAAWKGTAPVAHPSSTALSITAREAVQNRSIFSFERLDETTSWRQSAHADTATTTRWPKPSTPLDYVGWLNHRRFLGEIAEYSSLRRNGEVRGDLPPSHAGRQRRGYPIARAVVDPGRSAGNRFGVSS